MRLILSIVFISLFFIQSPECQETPGKSNIIETYKGASYYMHFTKKGETVHGLSQLYNVTNVEILRANPEISAGLKPDQLIRIPVVSSRSAFGTDQTASPEVQQHPDSTYHTVMPKETWYGISRLYKVPVNELISANPGVDTLKIGMNIMIPKISQTLKVITSGYAEHTVQPQETLYSLSKKYNTTIDEIIRLNPSVQEGLKIGQMLMVPATLADSPDELSVQVTDTTYIQHEVDRKETLYGIAKLYGIEMNDIIQANPNFDGKLRKGDFLRIPKMAKKVRPFAKPDTTILGREIDIQAIERTAAIPCTDVIDHRIQYNVALLVPMQLELVDSISVSDPEGLKSAHEFPSFDFIQFYQGAIIAADSMAALGMNVKIHVFDVDYGEQVTKTRRLLTNPLMQKMDLIIGPFFAESFDLIADFASQHSIPVVNPLSRRSEVIKGNQNVVKLQPSGWAQYNELSNYLLNKHANANIIVLRKNVEENKSMAQVIKTSYNNDIHHTKNFTELIHGANGWNIQKSLVQGKPNIIIITTSDQAILSALLRNLSDISDTYQISIIGLSEWEDLEIDYNYLIKLNTHFFKPWFVDYNNPTVKGFIRKFRDAYVAEPEIDKYAFLGYDATFYFLSALRNYGSDFLKCIDAFDQPGLSNDLIFHKSPDGGYENQSSIIYKYQDYNRIKVN